MQSTESLVNWTADQVKHTWIATKISNCNSIIPCTLHVILIVFTLVHLLSVPVPCPFTNPYAINGGMSCCKFYRQRYDATNCPGNNETSVTDPTECCTDGFIDCPDQTNGCKNNPLANGKKTICTSICSFFCNKLKHNITLLLLQSSVPPILLFAGLNLTWDTT